MNKEIVIGILQKSGTFIIERMKDYRCKFKVKKRNTYQFIFNIIADEELLKEIKNTIGVGSIYKRRYSICDKNIKKLITFLGDDPFVSEKRKKYQIWKEAFEYYDKNTGRCRIINKMVFEKMDDYLKQFGDE